MPTNHKYVTLPHLSPLQKSKLIFQKTNQNKKYIYLNWNLIFVCSKLSENLNLNKRFSLHASSSSLFASIENYWTNLTLFWVTWRRANHWPCWLMVQILCRTLKADWSLIGYLRIYHRLELSLDLTFSRLGRLTKTYFNFIVCILQAITLSPDWTFFFF